MAAHRDAVGQTGDLHPKGAQQPGKVHGGGLPLRVGIGGHDDLLDPAGGHPLYQGLDVQVIRPHVVHGGDHPVEHVVEPLVLPGPLHGHHVLRVGHHTDDGGVPLGAGEDGAGAVPLRQMLTHRTAVDGGLGGQNGLGKGGGVLLWEGEDVERQPLGGFDADAGQAGELLHQIFQCGGEILHGKDLRSRK